ncbi:MAG: S-layer homology domain-containing protein [Demequina sp.]|uniref:S-layer homology domain-containing protein n=1 Tax=Demequina sp. TaxID=2050685 RepID=UPI003A87F139
MRRAFGAMVLATLLMGALSPVAVAAEASPKSFSALSSALNDECRDGTVTLGATISGAGLGPLTVACSVTLDLNGHRLVVDAIDIAEGQKFAVKASGGGRLVANATSLSRAAIHVPARAALTINAGTVVASGGRNHAGIGGGAGDVGGFSGRITINGGSVTATGGSRGAGIGGGYIESGLSGYSGTVTINGGHVVARGTGFGAGIGGGAGYYGGKGGTIWVKGGTVEATGGEYGPGIGGGSGTDGRVTVGTTTSYVGTRITIGGGTVTATGGHYSAGIGGGWDGPGAFVDVTGGTVRATGGDQGAGIGGGLYGNGGQVGIDSGTVTAVAGDGASAVGGGGAAYRALGQLYVAGTLRVPAGDLIVDNRDSSATVRIAPTGRLLGSSDRPVNVGARVSGAGTIDNSGVIALAGRLVQVDVEGRDFSVAFVGRGGKTLQSVRVFAPNLRAGYRTLPTPPAGTAWNTKPDGSGRAFTATTTITRDTKVYAVAPLVPTPEPQPTPATGVTLYDVSSNSTSANYTPFHREIRWLANEGVTQGWRIGGDRYEYRPKTAITREAMAAFLYRYAGSPKVTLPSRSPFTDVSKDAKFYKEIVWLSQQGISTGWDVGSGKKEFRPREPISRDAMAAFLYRFAGEPTFSAPSRSPFTDTSRSRTQFYRETAWLSSTGVSTGWRVGEGKREFRPYEPITREAMAAFLYRYDATR